LRPTTQIDITKIKVTDLQIKGSGLALAAPPGGTGFIRLSSLTRPPPKTYINQRHRKLTVWKAFRVPPCPAILLPSLSGEGSHRRGQGRAEKAMAQTVTRQRLTEPVAPSAMPMHRRHGVPAAYHRGAVVTRRCEPRASPPAKPWRDVGETRRGRPQNHAFGEMV